MMISYSEKWYGEVDSNIDSVLRYLLEKMFFLNSMKHYFVSSATIAYFLILYVLKKVHNIKHVVGPNWVYPAVVNICNILELNYIPIPNDIETLNPKSSGYFDRNRERSVFLIVHFGGCITNDIFKIVEFCKKNNIFLIEDTCSLYATKYCGIPYGMFGDASIFSFSPNKLVSSHKGGLLCIKDKFDYICDQVGHIANQNCWYSAGTLNNIGAIHCSMNLFTKFILVNKILQIEKYKQRNRKIYKKYRENVPYQMNMINDDLKIGSTLHVIKNGPLDLYDFLLKNDIECKLAKEAFYFVEKQPDLENMILLPIFPSDYEQSIIIDKIIMFRRKS